MFAHLHLHTEYSLLDGFCRLHQLINRAKELGFEALAITDHSALYGVVDFYLACREAGLKPIIGCEVYIGSHDKNPPHLILLAKNNTGYKNLIKLVTWAHLNGFYYKPQISKEELERHSEGLIALSACTQGELGRLILSGDLEGAAKAALWYKEVFEDFYLEVQRHPLPELEKINQGLLRLSRELNLPLAATGDVHYIHREDAPIHDILLCIRTNSSIIQEKRPKMPGDFFYLHTPQEMVSLFSDLPQAIRSTEEIASKCEVEIELDRVHLPSPQLPEGIEAHEYLEKLSWEGIYRRFPQPSSELCSQLKYELDVIRHTGFAPYFLIVYDLFRFAKERGIMFGVRGSGASSLVLHVLGLTEINPLKYGLVFERFLNIERKELPDIDLDFEDRHRQEVIEYICSKYGPERVAQIITFGKMGAKAVVRDVGRALGLPYKMVDKVARLVPQEIGITLSEALKESSGLSRIVRGDENIRRLVELALRLEGMVRHASTHAAGIVISPEPLVNFVPLQRPPRASGGLPMTQFDMNAIARVGLLKLDVLGLANLTVLSMTRELLRKRGIEIDLQHLPLDDKNTFSLLSGGRTGGIFQLESPGMRRAIRELKPTSFKELAALIALYRPGPKEHIPEFVQAKHGKPVHYLHPAMEDILSETYGVIVYQEQVLMLAQALAGYSLGEADAFRKAIGKKIPEIMEREQEKFISKAVKKGVSREVAVKVFEMIQPFAGYAFNKAHSVSYALLAYQTAYLKANYPTEYMTSLLNSFLEKREKLCTGIAECHRLGIAVLPPDINRSQELFEIEDRGIRFGLIAIKNVGEGVVKTILNARKEGGHFKSVEDFCRRVELRAVGRKALESLIKGGSLDCLGERETLLYNLDKLISFSEQQYKLRREGQASLFDMGEIYAPLNLGLEKRGLSLKERCSWEREVLGVFLSNRLLQQWDEDKSHIITFCGDIQPEMDGSKVVVAGMVSSLMERRTKGGKPLLSVLVEDLTGSLEVIVRPELYAKTGNLWREGRALLIEGKVDFKGEGVRLLADKVQPHHPPTAPRMLMLQIGGENEKAGNVEFFRQLLDLLTQYPGEDEVYLILETSHGRVRMKWPGITVNYNPQLHQRLAKILGEGAIKLNP